MSTPLTYWDYLSLPKLLSLQEGADGEVSPDELHFIIVHQAYELWFKLLLREVRLARDRLVAEYVPEETVPAVVHHLRRVSAVLELMNRQWTVMETLTPQDFLAFRDKLSPASGFQSFQMRVLEILMGLDDAQRILYGKVDPLEHIQQLARKSPGGALAWGAIAQARSEPSLLAAVEAWLVRTPIMGSTPDDPGDEAIVNRFLDDYLSSMAEAQEGQREQLIAMLGEDRRDGLTRRFQGVREAAAAFLQATDVPEEGRAERKRCRAAALFIESYRELPLLAWPRLLLDAIVECEEQFVKFRHGHVRMVERLIGRRVGTGGSGGVDYLEKTGEYRVFRDLWAVRTVLLARNQVPTLEDPGYYGFANL